MCCFLFHSQNSANRGEELISSKGLQTEIANPTLTSFPVAWTNATNEINLENTAAGKVSNNVDTLSSRNGDDEQNVVCASLLEDSKNVRLQEAATKAQAAFRGYMVIFYIDTFISQVEIVPLIISHILYSPDRAQEKFCFSIFPLRISR